MALLAGPSRALLSKKRSEFLRGLSEKSEVERPGPARSDPFRHFWETYISETVHPISIRFWQGIDPLSIHPDKRYAWFYTISLESPVWLDWDSWSTIFEDNACLVLGCGVSLFSATFTVWLQLVSGSPFSKPLLFGRQITWIKCLFVCYLLRMRWHGSYPLVCNFKARKCTVLRKHRV